MHSGLVFFQENIGEEFKSIRLRYKDAGIKCIQYTSIKESHFCDSSLKPEIKYIWLELIK